MELIEVCRSQDCHKIWTKGSGTHRPLRAGAATTPDYSSFTLFNKGWAVDTAARRRC